MAPTVMLMTLNEEMNLEAAMQSFPPGTNFVVYDSFSNDQTPEIAERLGARIVQRSFDNWSSHQNWGARNIDFDCPWVYYCDADERMTPDLWRDICAAVARPEGHVAFEMRRKDVFLGKWIRHSSFYPTWFVRLYQPDRIRWERLVNPVPIVDGSVGRIDGHILHFPFSKGIGYWFSRHIQYADFEAQQIASERQRSTKRLRSQRLSRSERRRALKRLFQKMPARPLIKFLFLYFVHRGFLDGRAGFNYAVMQAIYEYMIGLRTLEIRRSARGLPV